jgi:hypothetical protein
MPATLQPLHRVHSFILLQLTSRPMYIPWYVDALVNQRIFPQEYFFSKAQKDMLGGVRAICESHEILQLHITGVQW